LLEISILFKKSLAKAKEKYIEIMNDMQQNINKKILNAEVNYTNVNSTNKSASLLEL